MEKMKKGSWGQGDRLEQELTEWNQAHPQEAARFRLRERLRKNVKRWEMQRDELVRKIDKEGAGKSEDMDKHQADYFQIEFCNNLLRRPDATLRDHYKLKGMGELAEDDRKTRHELILPMIFRDVPVRSLTADHVREAARQITEKYPEIHFDFEQTHDLIEYTASIRAPK